MGLREELLKKIDKKTQEVRELESQIREANAYIQGLQDVAKLLPRENSDERQSEHILRANSDMAKARGFLKKMGKPVYVGEILDGIGKGDTKPHRLSLSGSLGEYVRKGEIFTRPAPNTFGLVEFPLVLNEESDNPVSSNKTSVGDVIEPPDNFGLTISSDSEDDPFAD